MIKIYILFIYQTKINNKTYSENHPENRKEYYETHKETIKQYYE